LRLELLSLLKLSLQLRLDCAADISLEEQIASRTTLDLGFITLSLLGLTALARRLGDLDVIKIQSTCFLLSICLRIQEKRRKADFSLSCHT
jgi:hypothetical protein